MVSQSITQTFFVLLCFHSMILLPHSTHQLLVQQRIELLRLSKHQMNQRNNLDFDRWANMTQHQLWIQLQNVKYLIPPTKPTCFVFSSFRCCNTQQGKLLRYPQRRRNTSFDLQLIIRLLVQASGLCCFLNHFQEEQTKSKIAAVIFQPLVASC